MNPAVTTRSYSPYRDGANLSESRLTSTFIQANGISHLADLLVDDPRGIEAQPLYVPGLVMRDGIAHNVVFLADMSNCVYAFDLDTYKLLWKQVIGRPITVTRQQDMYLINPMWGILSTPVINLVTDSLYLISFSSPDGTIANAVYQFHTLSLVDGSNQAVPIGLNHAGYTPSIGTRKILGSAPRKQRAALLLDTNRNGVSTVFAAFGSFAESADSNLGGVLAIDVTNMSAPSIAAAWTTGGRHPGAGIWMAGEGLSMDDDGYIYGLTGNGGFDPPTDFGECFFKLQYTPATGSHDASLSCVDWWSPYSDAGRLGQDPTAPMPTYSMDMGDDPLPNNAMNGMADMDEMPMPNSAISIMAGMMGAADVTPPTSNQHKVGDQDLGSGGAMPIPKSITGFSKNAILGAGKDGVSYLVNMDDMGKTLPADFAPNRIADNYAKLLSKPIGFTFNGVGTDFSPTDTSMLPIAPGGKTAHCHGTPVCYQSPDHGFMIFVGGENQPVKAWRLNPDFTMTYLACSQEAASALVPPPGGMPGTMLSISANGAGTNTAVLWGLMPYGDANKTITKGRLIAWGANWIDETSGHLIKLWDSQDWGITFSYNKFNIPVVTNGKILVPTYDGRVMVLG